MAQYVLRDLPVDIWSRFTERANRDNWPLRALFLQLMEDFGEGRISPSAQAPEQMPGYAWVRPYYRHLARQPEFLRLNLDDQWEQLLEHVSQSAGQSTERPLLGVPPARRVAILQWLRDTATRDIREPNQLSMRAIAHIGEGPSLTENRRAIQYEVLGLPPGHQAWIAYFQTHSWRILRVEKGHQGHWDGSYGTPQEALRALETFIYIEEDPR